MENNNTQLASDAALAGTEDTSLYEIVKLDKPIVDKAYQLPPPLIHPERKPSDQFLSYTADQKQTYRDYSLFLAGSIEQGKAIQWQTQVIQDLNELPITVNNPRRGYWIQYNESKPEGKALSDKAMETQIDWELKALEESTVICFFFDVRTKSPVTMLELGLWAKSGKLVVCCGDDFFRATNVHRTCQRYNVPVVSKYEDFIPQIRKKLAEKGLKIDINEAGRYPWEEEGKYQEKLKAEAEEREKKKKAEEEEEKKKEEEEKRKKEEGEENKKKNATQ